VDIQEYSLQMIGIKSSQQRVLRYSIKCVCEGGGGGGRVTP
jgi:hypothetical protein